MQMLLPGLALSLASLALAAPASESSGSDVVTPPKAREFGIGFSIEDGGILSNYAVELQSDPDYSVELSLVGREMTHYPYVTPAYVNGTGDYTTAIVFDLTSPTNDTSLLYGAYADELGEEYGAVARVTANKGLQQFAWDVGKTIDHQRNFALQQLFACNATINGEHVKVLSFGVLNRDSSPPATCYFTKVFPVYTVPGGLSSRSLVE